MDPTFYQLDAGFCSALSSLSSDATQAGTPGKWNVQQTVEHLRLTYVSTSEILRERIEKGRPTRAKPGLQQHCQRMAIIGLGYFPHGRKAPLVVTPRAGESTLSGVDLHAQMVGQLERLDELLIKAALLFGRETRSASHFILGPLSPAEWRKFHVVHGRHHLHQIEKIAAQNRTS